MFEGKVVWITGASSGIGEGLALRFAKEKAFLILSSRRTDELERVKKECLQFTTQAEILPLDLSNLNALQSVGDKAISIFGKIDILINNGGISQRSNAMDTDRVVEEKIMNTNYFSAVALSKIVLPLMEKNKYGRIVLMCSVTSKIGVPGRSSYCASKHALIGYFDSLRAELKIKNSPVHIHIIMPGYVHTNISVHAVTGDGHEQGKMDRGQANGMPVDVCAEKILHAIKKDKKEIFIGGKEIWMAYIRRFWPWLYYKMIVKVVNK